MIISNNFAIYFKKLLINIQNRELLCFKAIYTDLWNIKKCLEYISGGRCDVLLVKSTTRLIQGGW